MKDNPVVVFFVVALLAFISIRIIWAFVMEPIFRPVKAIEEELGVPLAFSFADSGTIVALVAAVGSGLAAVYAVFRGKSG